MQLPPVVGDVSHIMFSSVLVADEWPTFGNYILTICNFSYFSFWYLGGIWVLIAPVPGHCILVTCFLLCLNFQMPLWLVTYKNMIQGRLHILM